MAKTFANGRWYTCIRRIICVAVRGLFSYAYDIFIFQDKTDIPKHWRTHQHRDDPRIPEAGTQAFFDCLAGCEVYNLRRDFSVQDGVPIITERTPPKLANSIRQYMTSTGIKPSAAGMLTTIFILFRLISILYRGVQRGRKWEVCWLVKTKRRGFHYIALTFSWTHFPIAITVHFTKVNDVWIAARGGGKKVTQKLYTTNFNIRDGRSLSVSGTYVISQIEVSQV